MLAIFAKSLLVGYSGAVMPGSLLAYVIDRSIRKGGNSGALATIGHALLELAVVIALILGADVLLTSNGAQIIIGIAGGTFLCWMAFTMIRDALKDKLIMETTAVTSKKDNPILKGAVLSGSNPYFLIWWAIIGLSLIIEAYAAFGIIGVLVFYIGHILADFTWYMLVSYGVSKTRKFIDPKVHRIITGVLGTVVLVLGFSFIIRAIILI
ncbi:MAG: LysE family transporter [Clostridiales bacterium]|nr:LysE family transporter [Clostridiales bacterium]